MTGPQNTYLKQTPFTSGGMVPGCLGLRILFPSSPLVKYVDLLSPSTSWQFRDEFATIPIGATIKAITKPGWKNGSHQMCQVLLT